MNAGVLLQFGPELILLVGACLTLLAGASSRSQRASWVSPLALVVVLVALLWALLLGADQQDPGIPGLYLTGLTFYVRCITLAVGALIVMVNWHQPVATERGEYFALIHFSLLGVLLTASASDLVVLFFAIELVSVPTYVLVAMSRLDRRASESAVKYFFLGAMSAAVLAYGMSFLYGAMGTTSIRSFAGLFEGASATPALIGIVFVFTGLAFKVAAVPLHVYVADVYEGAAAPMAGMLGFVPKLAGFIALLKIFSIFNGSMPASVFWMVWVVAALTMTVGNVLALLQRNVKRVLAYSSIAHTGYMLIALLAGPGSGGGPMRDGAAAIVFYMAIYGVMNLGAFAVLASFKTKDRELETYEELSGLYRRGPMAAIALAICAFGLMGFPPAAGFMGKLYIFGSAFSADGSGSLHGSLVCLAVIGVVNSAIGAAYYLRIVAAVLVHREIEDVAPAKGSIVRWSAALCAVFTLVLFVWPRGLAHEAHRATTSLRSSSPSRVVVSRSPADSTDHAAPAPSSGD